MRVSECVCVCVNSRWKSEFCTQIHSNRCTLTSPSTFDICNWKTAPPSAPQHTERLQQQKQHPERVHRQWTFMGHQHPYLRADSNVAQNRVERCVRLFRTNFSNFTHRIGFSFWSPKEITSFALLLPPWLHVFSGQTECNKLFYLIFISIKRTTITSFAMIGAIEAENNVQICAWMNAYGDNDCDLSIFYCFPKPFL